MYNKLKFVSRKIKLFLINRFVKVSHFNEKGSQYGQDKWVLSTLHNKKEGFFIELGALDGLHNSNTILLEDKYDWIGICIEAHLDSFQQLTKNRKCTVVNACVDGHNHSVIFHQRDNWPGGSGIVDRDTDNKFVPTNSKSLELQTFTLEQILDKYEAPKIIDYLSLDTEGSEFRIMSNFNYAKYKFRCLTIERCPKKLHSILVHQGYKLVNFIRIPDTGKILDHCYIYDKKIEEHETTI